MLQQEARLNQAEMILDDGPRTELQAAFDWAGTELPAAWVDQLNWRSPRQWWQLWRRLSGRKREPVRLPDDLPGAASLPRYLLQEFHNLPNGNYSLHFSAGYARGFDRAMLGSLQQGRARIAAALAGSRRVLDLGSGAGHLAGSLLASGIPEVTGLEPSPYLLQQAARRYPGIHWVQGVGEASGLPDGYFDAVGICFVLHEVPPRYLQQMLTELRRIMRPGARLAILEPSSHQWHWSYARIWRQYGWRGLYFRLLARRVHEPFADAWHGQDVAARLAEQGFQLLQDDTGCPFRFILAQREQGSPQAEAAPEGREARHSPIAIQDMS
jgi:ubiquinone/menaquinone biosynthesis C-methylase UbiE